MATTINRNDNRTVWWTVLALIVIAVIVYAGYNAYQSNAEYITQSDTHADGTDTTITPNRVTQ